MSNKVKIIIIIIIVFLIALAFGLYIALTPSELLPTSLQKFSPDVKNTTLNKQDEEIIDKTIIYYPADFSENIYNDSAFTELMNLYALEFIDGDMQYKLPLADLEKYGGELAIFFYDYFTSVRNGDANAYNSYIDERAFAYMEKKTEFTMQQIYDISIKPMNIQPELDKKDYSWVFEAGIEPIYVEVKYKIRRNNGTFRLGVDSDTEKPQLYIMYKTKDTYKIISIVDYE